MRPCKFTRGKAWAATNESGNGEIVMWHSQWRTCAASRSQSCCRADRANFRLLCR